MITASEKAYAKINISLDVKGKRPDGYHNMVMVMQTVSLCDGVFITLTEDGTFCAESNLHFIPNDERNLAVRAAKAFFEATGESTRGAVIKIDKHIPVGAGMAGGSTDAAAVLRALNSVCGSPFDKTGLEKLAAGVGSDVAFCVEGGTKLATGRGEELKPLPDMPDCHIVICKPEFSISTPELFKKLDSVKLRCHPDTEGICSALSEGNIKKLARRMYNVFEDVPDRRMNTVPAIKGVMLDYGALGSIMTGTGSAVFGIYEDKAAAEKTISELSKEYRYCYLANNKGKTEV